MNEHLLKGRTNNKKYERRTLVPKTHHLPLFLLDIFVDTSARCSNSTGTTFHRFFAFHTFTCAMRKDEKSESSSCGIVVQKGADA